MDLGTIAKDIFQWGISVFSGFNVTFGDLTINGWALLLGGAIVYIVVRLVARAFD